MSESDGKTPDGGSQEPSGAATRSVETDNGTVQVPREPRRVVVLENYDALMLLDLGLVPVGIPDGAADPQLLPEDVYEQLKDVDTIGASGTPNSQAIAALKPELIIDQFYTEKSAALRTIAAVAFFDWHTSGAFWNEQIAELAKAVNRESRVTDARTAARKQIDTTTCPP
ncbi:ABC transporter substrate-binding protein [Streptomyces sp. MT29]|nr:ABC transporter substrate-binding protein [Streptomyces sp. MT29]